MRFMIIMIIIMFIMMCSIATGQRVQYGNRWYSGRVCSSPNCSMCNQISAMLRAQRRPKRQPQIGPKITGYRRVKYCDGRRCWWVNEPIYETQKVKQVTPSVELNTPPKADPGQVGLGKSEIDQALRSLKLTAADVFADIGAGDGRILIAAVERYGCRAVGVEIDAGQVAAARKAIAAAEKEKKIPRGRITLLHMDAADFDPRRYGITAATAYLFPETLDELKDVLAAIPVVAVPFHEIPGEEKSSTHQKINLYANR